MNLNGLKAVAALMALQAVAKCKTCLDSHFVLGDILDRPMDETKWEPCPDCSQSDASAGAPQRPTK